LEEEIERREGERDKEQNCGKKRKAEGETEREKGKNHHRTKGTKGRETPPPLEQRQ
jgi:hypothetical protein